MNRKWVEQNTIHKIVAGSHLYGTARDDSDIDIRGVCLMPKEAVLGFSNFDQYISNDGEDVTIYGLRKFMKLALGANPNILDILFAPTDKWLVQNADWWFVWIHRKLFLSQRVRNTFSGYAASQLKRLKGHYQWLTNPPNHEPTLEEFGGKLISDSKGGQTKLFPSAHDQWMYDNAAKHWKQYQTWLRERNPARARLEKEYGYDTKHASHLVRLLIKVKGVLESGDYNPVLDELERATVLEVLHGGWPYEYLIEWAEEADAAVMTMPSELPGEPKTETIELVLMIIHERTLCRNSSR